MKFSIEFGRTKAAPPALMESPSTWWPMIRESFTGAWQRNVEVTRETVMTYHAVYSCVTLIASDVSKCNIRLVEKDSNGIWSPIEAPSFSPVLRKPNHYQNRIKFYEQWTVSKLLHGNTYVLKERDARNIVVGLYILNPMKTRPLVAPDGAIYYQTYKDNLSGVTDDDIAIPASEIIHDVMVPLYHPLCGVSPLTACGVAAVQGLNIQKNSSKLFANGSFPGGVLTAPAAISNETAGRIKQHWDEKYAGEGNVGKVAVLGDGLKFEQMAMKAIDSQLIEQLKWSAETICSTFHVPSYKVGVAAAPAYNNIEALDQQYYSQCLQKLFECIELCLDEGLGLVDVKGKTYGVEFDLDDLLRMDTATLVEAESKATSAGIKKLDEARLRLNLPPMKGGNAAYLQQQNYSVEALAKRDALDNPFAPAIPPPPPKTDPANPDPAKSDSVAKDWEDDIEDAEAFGKLAAWQLKTQLALLRIQK